MNTFWNLPGKIWITIASLDPLLRRRARHVSECLNPAERELYLDMTRYDLAHSLAVSSKLRDDPILYKAALLHDAGKLRSDLNLFTRWLHTGLEIFMHPILRRQEERLKEMAEGEDVLERARSLPRGWRRGLYIQFHHGEIGAEILRKAGSEDAVIELVQGHQGEPRDQRSRRLAEVDDSF
jgi:hypothetical protein